LEDALLEERQFKFRGKTILSQQDIENILWSKGVNDKVVNGFMAMAAVEMGLGAYTFNSLFFPEEKDMTYWAKQVSLNLTSMNSTDKKTLASVNKILLPLCWDSHWSLMVIQIKD
jgi:Ulp1 family protease